MKKLLLLGVVLLLASCSKGNQKKKTIEPKKEFVESITCPMPFPSDGLSENHDYVVAMNDGLVIRTMKYSKIASMDFSYNILTTSEGFKVISTRNNSNYYETFFLTKDKAIKYVNKKLNTNRKEYNSAFIVIQNRRGKGCSNQVYSSKFYIIDGDTIKIGEERFRFGRIDAPEMGTKSGKESRSYLIRQIGGKEIKIVRTGIGYYGRTIAEIYLGDVNINDLMVSSGHAKTYIYKN